SLGAPLERFQVDDSLPITGDTRGVIAGDIRGDGLARIIVSSNSSQYVHVFGFSAGSYVEEWSDIIPSESARLIPIAVGDVDNDFQNEFLVASQDSVYMYKWNGTTYERVFQQALAWANKPTVILDLDRDGLNEVVLGPSGSVGIYKYQAASNSLELVWSTPESSSSLQIAAGDVDQDGQSEVCYIGRGSPGKIVVLGYDGANYVVEAEITGFANGLGGGAIGDFNGDGKQEIIAGLYNVAAASWPIYHVEYDGSNYQVSTLYDATMGMFQVHAGDIDGDGLPEANVLRNSGGSFLVEYESSSYVVSEVSPGGGVYGDIADVDGDGLGELVVATSNMEIVSDVLGTSDANAPPVPAGLTAAPSYTQVILNWAASQEPDLSHYLVYQSITSGFTPSGANLVGPVSKYNTAVALSGLTNDTPYYFRIATVDEAGNESAPSAQVSGTPVNLPPTITVLSPNGGEVFNEDARGPIEWVATDDDLVTHVELHYTVDGGQTYTVLTDNYPNEGSTRWRVRRVPTTQARIKIIAHDSQGLTAVDSSEGFFTIQDVDTYVHATGSVSHTIRNDGVTGNSHINSFPAEPSLELPPGGGGHHLHLGQLLLMNANTAGDTAVAIPYRDNYHPLSAITTVDQGTHVETWSRFEDKLGLGMEVTQHTLAANNESSVILAYTVRNNNGATTYDQFYVGSFSNFNPGDGQNNSGYDTGNNLAYMYGGGWSTYAGLRMLDQAPTGFRRWIYSDLGWETPPGEHFRFLTEPVFDNTASDTAGNYRLAETVGPLTLAPGDSVTVAFALAVGGDLADPHAASQAAQDLWTLV
ncbi:MAG: FG-GAP-like repeat-containing protein, partial [Candidatus Neomarinimicrobiota bacterium]